MQGNQTNDTVDGGYCPVGNTAGVEWMLDHVLGFCRGIWVVQSLWIGAFNGSFDPGLSFGGSYHWLRGIGVLYVFGRGIGDDLSLETWQKRGDCPEKISGKGYGGGKGESPQEYVRRRIHKPGRSLKAGRKEAFVGTEEFETLQGKGDGQDA